MYLKKSFHESKIEVRLRNNLQNEGDPHKRKYFPSFLRIRIARITERKTVLARNLV